MKIPKKTSGARMLRQAAEKTGEMVGDGTSTATILAHACSLTACETLSPAQARSISSAGLDRGAKRAIEALEGDVAQVKTRKEKAQVAAISAHNDPAIGELVADAMDKVGGEGVITSRSRKQLKRHSKSSRECSSTAASSRPIS